MGQTLSPIGGLLQLSGQLPIIGGSGSKQSVQPQAPQTVQPPQTNPQSGLFNPVYLQNQPFDNNALIQLLRGGMQ